MKNLPSLRAVLAAALFASCLPSLFAAEHLVADRTELDAAVAIAEPGDHIVFANGSYSTLYIHLTCHGAAGNPITLRPETPGGVTFTGNSRIRIAGNYIVVQGFRFEDVGPTDYNNVVVFSYTDYSRLTQCYFLRCGKDKWKHIVQVTNNATNNRIDHNTWEDIKGQGIGIVDETDSINNRIDHNYFSGAALENQGNGNEPIQLGQGGVDSDVMNAIVEFNLIENMHSPYADPELISVKTAGNIIRFNTFRNNATSRELTLRDAQNCTVEGNFLFDCGLRVYGSGHKVINNYISGANRGINLPGADGSNYPATNNVLIANNTIIDPATSGISIRTGSGSQISGITVKNNLVQGGASGAILYEQAAGITGCTYATNLGYDSDDATVSSGATVAITSNPNLFDDGIIHRLPSGSSPAKSAGTATAEITSDLDGQPRTSPLDLGADEYAAALVARFPLLTTDVGPAWLGGPAEDDGTTGSEVAVPGGSVTASTDDGNVAANTVDASLATRWSGNGAGAWLLLDLGATYTVTHLGVAVHQGTARRTGFHVQLSDDGTTWSDVAGTATRPLLSSGTTLSLETYNTPDARGRYVRLVGLGNTVNLWNSLTEVEVFGHSPTLAAIADTYAFGGSPNTTYGSALTFAAKNGTGTNYDRIAFVQFDLSKLTFTPGSATLVLTTASTTEAGTLTVNQCTTDTWTEAALNWNNKPAVGTAIANETIAAATVTDVSTDTSSYVLSQFTGDPTKLVSFALTGTNAQLFLQSRETGSANSPTLIVAP